MLTGVWENWLRDYSQDIDVGGLKQLPKDGAHIVLLAQEVYWIANDFDDFIDILASGD